MLRAIGTEIKEFSITLIWNAEEDLDLSFTCSDGTVIDNSGGSENECGANFDID